MHYEVLFLFLIAAVLLTLSPGPDYLLVITKSVAEGWGAASRFSLGLVCGLFLHTALVVVGVGTLVTNDPQWLFFVKCIGAVYLLYIAFQAWRAPKIQLQEKQPQDHGNFRTGFVMNITNPKVLLFFLSFFPGFLFHDQWSEPFQFAILGLLFILQALFIFLSTAFLIGKLQRKLNFTSQFQYWNQLQALLFIGIAILLLFY